MLRRRTIRMSDEEFSLVAFFSENGGHKIGPYKTTPLYRSDLHRESVVVILSLMRFVVWSEFNLFALARWELKSA